jgi:hypothetical protein
MTMQQQPTGSWHRREATCEGDMSCIDVLTSDYMVGRRPAEKSGK